MSRVCCNTIQLLSERVEQEIGKVWNGQCVSTWFGQCHLDVTVISQTPLILTLPMWDNLNVIVISQTPHMLTSQMWDDLDVTVISQTPHMLTSQKWCQRDITGMSNKDVTVWHVCDIFLFDVETVLHVTCTTVVNVTPPITYFNLIVFKIDIVSYWTVI